MDYRKLIATAKKAKRFSYAPHSKFRVGAAVKTRTGKIYTGCNIENPSFSLTMCAERIALFKAVSEGQHRFEAIAIASDLKELVPPCGACRQVIMDLAGDIDIVLCNDDGRVSVTKLSTLLPLPFDGSFLQHSK